VAPSSSSTKKAAKLAKSGQGRKVRFQGGTLFPTVVAVVLVLGLSLVVWARESRPTVDASAPTVNDHWHHAYGFYLCDTWFKLTGDAEERDDAGFLNTDFARTGIHSHDDGLMHWHAFSRAAVGSNARLGVFLDTYDVELTNDVLRFPPSQRAELPYQQETGEFLEGTTKCVVDGREVDGDLKAVVWSNFTDTGAGTTYIADFRNIRLDRNEMVVAVAFVPANTDVTMPPWARDLPALGAVDSGQLTPGEIAGLEAEGTVPPGQTVPEETVPAATETVPAATDG
jgi:hypothetical protein